MEILSDPTPDMLAMPRFDDGRARVIDGPVEWARLEEEAGKMLESGLELADRVEAA